METGQPYAYTGDNPVNDTDPLGLCSTSGGTYLVAGACDWTSRSWVSQTENTLQSQKGGGFSLTNGLKAVADYGAGIGNVVTSTVTLGHVQIAAPYCGFGFASDTGTIFGTLALGVLGGGAGAAGEVAEGTATVEEVEAGAQAGISVAAGDGASSSPASLVRMVSDDESQADLFNELKARTFETGNEHALVTLSSGDQAILSGGQTGIDDMEIENLVAHTHPYQLPASGVSDADYAALNQLGQESSILLEHGQEIPFGTNDPQYLKLFGEG
jgi:hypothetical protein